MVQHTQQTQDLDAQATSLTQEQHRATLGRVALGMSGGVDSAVSAALLLRAGYEVVGVTCRFLDGDATDRAIHDAAAVCDALGIPQMVPSCIDQFRAQVIRPYVAEYACGKTPSPCIACNAHCKLPALINAAQASGCDHVATGHYARIVQLESNGRFVVKTALDPGKDQSYMLSLLSQEQLSQLILPLGGMTKPAVRIMAEDLNLPVAHKPESQDACFIVGDYRDFLLAQGVQNKPGDIIDRTGRVLGQHDGLTHFTIGQRKGIGVAAMEPYYVIEKRYNTNELVVGFANEALIESLHINHINWQAWDADKISFDPIEAFVKLRYRSKAVPCIIEPDGVGGGRIALQSPQPTTAPGQYAVFYRGDTVLGGGMIEEVG